jgi:hypothetical protein
VWQIEAAAGNAASAVGGALEGIGVIVIILVLYFLPSIIAVYRKVPNAGSIIVINVLLGWTFIGWVIAMAMAARDPRTAMPGPPSYPQRGYPDDYPAAPPPPSPSPQSQQRQWPGGPGA